MNEIIISCPYCFCYILIEQLNCCIFRHGVFKTNNQQINPHEKKENCDNYILHDLIIGCGKPFKIIKNDKEEYIAVICEYI